MRKLQERDVVSVKPVFSAREATAEDKAELLLLKTQLDTLSTERIEKRTSADKNDLALSDLNARGRSVRELLGWWYSRARDVCSVHFVTQFICPVADGEEGKLLQQFIEEQEKQEAVRNEYEKKTGRSINEAEAFRQTAWTGNDAKEAVGISIHLNYLNQRVANAEADLQRKKAHEVRLILGSLAAYIIPLAMGLLGALAFILQSLTAQLRNHSHTPVSISAYVVRLCLGAIAGVFGGLAGSGSDALLKDFPPLFVPFIFGYGIEIFFSLLNRIVSTFTQNDSAKA